MPGLTPSKILVTPMAIRASNKQNPQKRKAKKKKEKKNSEKKNRLETRQHRVVSDTRDSRERENKTEEIDDVPIVEGKARCRRKKKKKKPKERKKKKKGGHCTSCNHDYPSKNRRCINKKLKKW